MFAVWYEFKEDTRG